MYIPFPSCSTLHSSSFRKASPLGSPWNLRPRHLTRLDVLLDLLPIALELLGLNTFHSQQLRLGACLMEGVRASDQGL